MFFAIIIHIVLNNFTFIYSQDGPNIVQNESFSSTTNACPSTCQTQECEDEANDLLNYMDLSVNPCDNFYKYACGNFIKTADVPSEGINYIATRLEKNIFNDTTRQLQEDIESNYSDMTVKIKTFYRNCMESNRAKKDDIKLLQHNLKDLGGWPILVGPEWNETSFNWIASLKKLADKNVIDLFPVQLGVNDNGSSRHYLNIQDLDVTFRSFGEDALDDAQSRLYFKYMWKVAEAMGAKNPFKNKTFIYNEVLSIFEFENNFINEAKKSRSYNSKPVVLKIKDLSKYLPIELFNIVLNKTNVVVDLDEDIVVDNIDFVSKIDGIISSTSPRVLANYMGWAIIKPALRFMFGDLGQLQKDYKNSILGASDKLNGAEICKKDMENFFDLGMSAIYIERHLSEAAIDDVIEIFNNVRGQMKEEIKKLEWMDSTTQNVAQGKLDSMDTNIRTTFHKWNDRTVNEYYKNLKIHPGSYYHSFLNVTVFELSDEFKKLKDPQNADDLNSIFLFGAQNLLHKNSLDIPIGFLSRPVYSKNRPQYLNYGGIGFILGHEIAHAFDNSGRFYDKNGKLNQWWDNSTEDRFFKRAECLIQQYHAYRIRQGNFSINGNKTLNENFADHGGVKAAYFAYNRLIKQNNIIEPCLPKFENYTGQQMYWISLANNYCSKYSPEFMEYDLSKEDHCPDEARVNIPFANSEDFARDFGCKSKTRMNPEGKCKIF